MGGESERRELLLMRAGAHLFAVYAGEAEGVEAWREPAPLPHAPAAVLGVVCVRGRMRTVLDPAALIGASAGSGATNEETAARFVVTLRGDEQLALAVAHAEPAPAPDAPAAPPDPPAPFLRATLPHQGRAVHLLDPSRLFDAALQGAERRRPRQK
ncbi:MAG TPA: chemotaxis protein CheW [Pyrinomonadaceae bacterium]|nr:chemotaxis protein CheW [Pyrinomonadaceae bacterium]